MIKTVKKYLIPHDGNSYKPHLLRETSISVLFVIGFLLFCTSLGSSYILKKTAYGATVLPAVLVDLTNEQRVENNGKALTVSPILEKAALMKAKDMAENQYFAHISPSGVTPWQWFYKAGYNFVFAGENLAINFTESSDVEKAWIASPTHYANLINNKFDETGIATYQGTYQGQPTTFVVQLFGKRVSPNKVAVSPVTIVSPTKIITKTNQKIALAPEVKGESIAVAQNNSLEEPAPVLMVDDPTFTVAQNINQVQPSPNIDSPVPKYASALQNFLAHQAVYVQYIYLGFIVLVYIVLLFMIVVEFRIQHAKNIALAILLLCFLGALAYLNSAFVLSFI